METGTKATKVVLLVIFVTLIGASYATSSKLVGRYELTSDPADKKYMTYLSALGVSEQVRTVISRIKINIQIEKVNDDSYKLRLLTPLLNRETIFKFGEEISDSYIDGRKYKTKFFLVSEDIVKQEITFDDGKVGIGMYTFSTGGLTATLTAKGKVAVRVYRRMK